MKKDIIKSLALHKKDVGSTVVQIGLLSSKIEKLSDHFKKFKKDKHSTMGLTKSVNQRKRLLNYLSKNDPKAYSDLIKKLNLKKQMFKEYKEEIDFGGKKLTLETGKIARQADAAIIATWGETVVISTVVGAKKVNPEIDYFPLSVNY